jgi:hypothetical protein
MITYSTEPLRSPNPGLMHPDSAIGRAWEQLGEDRAIEVDGHALGNHLAEVGEGISRRHCNTNHAYDRLCELQAALVVPGSSCSAARVLEAAIDRLDAPDCDLPDLPVGTPEPLVLLVADLNEIRLVRRGYDEGARTERHETDEVAALTWAWADGQMSNSEFRRRLSEVSRWRHESSEGWCEIRDAFAKALETARSWSRPGQ